MDSSQEIPLDFFAGNPLVRVYNAEPNWISGSLASMEFTINVLLGLLWIILRLVLIVFIFLWNQILGIILPRLPAVDDWPVYFSAAIAKVKHVPIISNPRFLLALLLLSIILYIVLDLYNRCTRMWIQRVILPSAGTVPDIDSFAILPGALHALGGESAIRSAFARIHNLLLIKGQVDDILWNFITSQHFVLVAWGLVFLCLTFREMGDPVELVTQPNSSEWDNVYTAGCLILYRAGSLWFANAAAYYSALVTRYGFQRASSVYLAVLALFASIISWAHHSIDRSSDLWKRAVEANPVHAISTDNGFYWMVFGLIFLLVFASYIGWKAHAAFRVYRHIPTGFFGTIFICIIGFFFDIIGALWDAIYDVYEIFSVDYTPPLSPRVNPRVSRLVILQPIEQPNQQPIRQFMPQSLQPRYSIISYVEDQISYLIGMFHHRVGVLVVGTYNIVVKFLKWILSVTGNLSITLFALTIIIALSQVFGVNFASLFSAVLEIACSWVNSSFVLVSAGAQSVLGQIWRFTFAMQSWFINVIEAKISSRVIGTFFFFCVGGLTVGVKTMNDWLADVWYGIVVKLFGLGFWITAVWVFSARLFSGFFDLFDFIPSLSFYWNNFYLALFLIVATFKLLKVLVHSLFYNGYCPPPMSATPKFSPGDVTVIVPTRGDRGKDKIFLEGLDSILENSPAEVIITTNGLDKHKLMNIVSGKYGTHRVKVTSIAESNLRKQFLQATNISKTKIICYANTGVRWSPMFLLDALTPFNDENVDLVGVPTIMNRMAFVTNPKLAFSGLRVIWNRFLHYLASIYYERYNYESQATNTIDGGIQVVSNRTALIRTEVVQSAAFLLQFPTETWLFGQLPPHGGMRVDDAEFITRFVFNSGKKTVFRTTRYSTINVRDRQLGFLAYCGKIALGYRGTWRSNLTSLFSGRKCCWYCGGVLYHVLFGHGVGHINMASQGVLATLSINNTTFPTPLTPRTI